MTERRLLFLIGAVQFINTLDFMMVMPLGPDFAKALDIPSSQLGLIGGAYVAAAAVAGIVGAYFLDRFDRRKALAVALAGLVIGTAVGGFAVGMGSMIGARVLAGMFGGPATALSMAIISDVVPPERRGRAMGAVMGAFAVASVLGVPAGLELARVGSWRTPFFTVAALGVVIASLAIGMLPSLTGHLDRKEPPASLSQVLRRPTVLLLLAATVAMTVGTFSLIPNLSAYFQFNLGVSRASLSTLYLVGGACTFVTMRIGGWATDRFGAGMTSFGGALWFCGVLAIGFIHPVSMPVIVLFVAFMISSSFRMVPLQALSSRVPAPAERARFMSAQSAVQHLASAFGAMLGPQMLTERADHSLEGIDTLAMLAVGVTIAVPILLLLVEQRLGRGANA